MKIYLLCIIAGTIIAFVFNTMIDHLTPNTVEHCYVVKAMELTDWDNVRCDLGNRNIYYCDQGKANIGDTLVITIKKAAR